MRGVLGCRLAQLSIVRGASTRQKHLVVKDMPPEAIFAKIQAGL